MPSSDPLARHHVTVAGNAAAARSIVFVHGFGTDQTAWAPVAAAFADDFRLILLDNAGAGRSAPDAFLQHRYLSLRGYVDDLLAVCAALEVRDAVLVGHSVGAMIAALATLRQPALASRLVMIAASPRYLDADGYVGGLTEAQLADIYSAIVSRFDDWTLAFAPAAMANPAQPELARQFADTIRSIPSERVLTVLCSILQSDHRAEIAQLATPTLLLQTREDGFVPMAVAEYLHAHIRGSLLRVIDATGHLPHLSAPDAVVAAMRDFLRD